MEEFSYTEHFPQEEPMGVFPVDLNREEYIAFNLFLAQNGGILRFRKGQLILFGLLLVFSLAMLLVEWMTIGSLDVVLLLLVVFIVLAGAFLLYGLPAYLRRNAGRTYDQSVTGGQQYYGMLYLYPDRVEKVVGDVTNVIRYADNAAYMENDDMIVLLASASRAIVLPARCMTGEDAEQVRQTVLPHIPPMRRRIIGKMVAKADRRMDAPAIQNIEEQQDLLTLTVQYTPEEFVKMVGDAGMRTYVRMLPFFSIISLFSGLLFGMLSGYLVGFAAFVVIMLLLFFPTALGSRLRARHAVQTMDANGLTLHLRFTNRGIIGTTPGQIGEMRLAWTAVQHAVDKKDCVEFYNSQTFIRIPKRCIDDMDLLRQIVDTHRTGKN